MKARINKVHIFGMNSRWKEAERDGKSEYKNCKDNKRIAIIINKNVSVIFDARMNNNFWNYTLAIESTFLIKFYDIVVIIIYPIS